jgi:hypothetical protein
MAEAIRKYTEAMEKVKAARESAKATASVALVEGLKEIFAAHPSLQTIGWTQYTPYFNDGDTCEFGVHADAYSLRLNGNSPDYGDDELEDEDGNPLPALTEDEDEAIREEVAVFIGMFDDDDLKANYGDHVKVTIKRDGTSDTDDFEHD